MADERNWRDAKPRWVVEAAAQELDELLLHSALSWPMEADPEPVFTLGEYDKIVQGKCVAGVFWVATHEHVYNVELRAPREGERRDYMYGLEANLLAVDWTGNVMPVGRRVRGRYFTSEHDAALSILWAQCRDHAKKLRKFHDMLRRFPK